MMRWTVPRGVAACRWRRRALVHYRQFVKSGDLVFDVGANVGNRTAVFLRLGARVVAVEPHASCVAELTNRW